MRVKKVHFENYMVHPNRDFEIGETGLCLIVGPNGVGKSSLCEGVASLYNASLRAPKSRRNRGFVVKQKGLVRVETYDGLIADRTSSTSGTLGLSYSQEGQIVDFPTASKALEQFERDNGSFEVWRRCCYFSSKSAARFTEALDSERRALLEELVAIGDYSIAHTRAQEQEKSQNKTAGEKLAALNVARNQLEVVARDVENAKQGLAALTPPLCPGTDADLQVLRAACTQLTLETQALQAQFAPLDKQLADLDTQAHQHTRDAATLTAELRQTSTKANLLGQGACPTCAQAIPPALTSALQEQVTAANNKVQQHQVDAATAQANAGAIRVQVTEQRRAIQAGVDATQQRYNDTKAQGIKLSTELANYKTTLEQHAANKKRWEAMVADAAQKSADATALTSKLQQEVVAAQHKGAVASTAAWILGPKGFRTHLLGNILGSVESVTNRWLALMDPKLRVELKAYDEDSKAATQAISLKIHGRTTGDEYVDLSTGERLRVDLAFLFGFAEVTELIHGGSATLGTLWLDEVFDGVDDEGVESAIDLIRHVAEKRAVVVITHNDRLKLKLQPDTIYALKKVGTP
jgi:DNA repair exonuclease SbcCD ATPase subunit